MTPDWLAAVDDLLTGRLTSCVRCGRVGPGNYFNDVALVEQLAVAVVVCARCWESDPQRTQLQALLAQRYRPLS